MSLLYLISNSFSVVIAGENVLDSIDNPVIPILGLILFVLQENSRIITKKYNVETLLISIMKL